MAGFENGSFSGYCSSPEWVEPYNATCSKCGTLSYGMLPEGTMFLAKCPTARCPVCHEDVKISEEETVEGDAGEVLKEDAGEVVVGADDVVREESEHIDGIGRVKVNEGIEKKKNGEDFLDNRIKLNERIATILQEMIVLVEASIKSKSKKRRLAAVKEERRDAHENKPKKRRLN